MASKQKKPKPQQNEPGVPEWVVTFGDMMSLLLCFFILLAAFSELKKEHEYQRVITAVKEAFGWQGGQGFVPSDDEPTRSFMQILSEMALESRSKTERSQADVQGMVGQHSEVKRIREGLVFTIGGNSTFQSESAVLSETAKADLRAIANLIRGRNNKIAIRGHADSKTLSPDSEWKDLYELSYARARSVMQFLVEQMGMREEVFYLDARGASEPVNPRAVEGSAQQINRRVEIILTETLLDEVNPDAYHTDPDHARGG